MRAEKGFSVIELLIAIAIILVLTAIAIPSLLRSRVAANESLAVGAMRQIDTAETAYASTYPASGYANSLTQLGPPVGNNAKVSASAAGMLDSVLGCSLQPCVRDSYGFAIDAPRTTPATNYRSIAMPIHPGISGGRGFCDDQTHHMTYDPDGNAHCTKKME
jgi:prepilin-type N-terminal cleavage/methylation domain-containing protein